MKYFWNKLGIYHNQLEIILLSLTLLAAFYIGMFQNNINQQLLELNQTPSIFLYFETSKMFIVNQGKENILIYRRQLKLDEQATIINNYLNEPVVIIPGHYYSNSVEFYNIPDGEYTASVEVWFKNSASKYTSKHRVFFTFAKGNITNSRVQTNFIGKLDWPDP